MTRRACTLVFIATFVAALILCHAARADSKQIVLGNRIPHTYFITWGMGQSDVGIHTGSYDAALKQAKIENANIMTYSSVMPPEAVEVPVPEKLHHGCVLETIMADMSGKKGERLTAALITWNIKRTSDGALLGGFVAEYHGHGSVQAATENLNAALEGMNERRGYTSDKYEVTGEKLFVKSFVPEKAFGTVIVAIGFTSYIWPVLD